MIDEKRIVQNLKDFSFPRLSGTEFEKKSFNLVKKKIEELQLTPKIQEFTYSTFYSRIYPKISLTVLSWLLTVLFKYSSDIYDFKSSTNFAINSNFNKIYKKS